MTPVNNARDALSPMRHESKQALKLETKVDYVAGEFFIPLAPGPMPESRSVEKVKSDIKKTKEFIAAGGKIDTFSEQIAKKALEISIKSRDQSLIAQASKEEKPQEHLAIRHEHTVSSVKQRLITKVTLPSHHEEVHESSKVDSSTSTSRKREVEKQFEVDIEKARSESSSKHRRKVIKTEVRQGKDERINNKNEQDRQDRLKPAG